MWLHSRGMLYIQLELQQRTVSPRQLQTHTQQHSTGKAPVKTELILVSTMLAAGYGTVDTESLRTTVIDYHCNHYRVLESVDEGHEFNPPEVYQNIYRTCDQLRQGVVKKPQYSIKDL